MSDFNDKETCSSWLMYYLGNKNEDEFVTTTVKLGYTMLTKKMDNITTAAMWQESIIFLTSQKNILIYLSIFLSSRLAVPEYYIDKLRQNYVILQCNYFISDHKKHIFGLNLSQRFSQNLLKVYIVKSVLMYHNVNLYLI